MSRRSRSNFLEPFPDEGEVFQPFDQHRPLPTIKDSLKLKKVSLKVPVQVKPIDHTFFELIRSFVTLTYLKLKVVPRTTLEILRLFYKYEFRKALSNRAKLQVLMTHKIKKFV